MDIWRLMENPDDLPTPADRCGHCGQRRTPLVAVPVPQHRQLSRFPIAPQTNQSYAQGQRTLEGTYRQSYYAPNLGYPVNSSGTSAEVSRTSNRHWSDNVELCFDDKSGTHAAQVKRDSNAQASERSRRKRIMKRLNEAEREIKQKDEALLQKDEALLQKDEALRQSNAELLQSNAELLQSNAEKERLRQQLEKQAQR
ncbi:hypothetical protein E4U60_007948 [Claviceps pazoutovae]|uniref:BZIP domain-containing protein n=1 Tax=Claviceps pazoutovae TaxID=1649127 RepID=A0A9P7MEN1_9HYPO|nr:hypothetical protein E4U60_007948 [Claviceps pazoutovae]